MNKYFIINPCSGRNKLRDIGFEILANDSDSHIIYTQKPGEATKIAHELSNSIVYSVGGDGTLNEVVNGVVGTNNAISVIPLGSGNDFYRVLKEQKSFSKCDIGKINDKYFINVACIGIDAMVAYNTDIMKGLGLNPSRIYIYSILYTFLTYQGKKIAFKLDKDYKDKYTIVTVCNGNYYGGGFNINPKGKLDDGLLDFYFVNRMSKLQMPMLLMKMKNGHHLEDSRVHYSQIKNITISSDKQLFCNYDGENMKDTNFDIKLIDNEVTLYNDKELVKKLRLL